MVDGPKGVPLEETLKIYKRNAGCGVVIKAASDARKAKEKEGVTNLPPASLYQRDKKLGRWRYAANVRTMLTNEPLGGRFVKVPPEFELKMGMKRPRKKRAST